MWGAGQCAAGSGGSDKCGASLDSPVKQRIFRADEDPKREAQALRRLFEQADPARLPADALGKVLNIIAFPQDIEHEDELRTIPVWKAHQLRCPGSHR